MAPARRAMAVETQSALLLALASSRFDQVLGTTENEEIDFKEGVYLLETRKQRWELAKDVASFANAQGGMIVVGYRTERHPNVLGDTAAEHRPVPKSLVNWDAYRMIIDNLVYPPVERLEAMWLPDDPSADVGVLAIVIPPQAESLKYFVVAEIHTNDDPTLPGALGVPVRRGADTTWLGREAIHTYIREARWLGQHGPAISDRGVAGDNDTPAASAIADQRVKDLEHLNEWRDVPFLALHAMPTPSMVRPDDFYSQSGLRGLLENPPALRPHGFSIQPWSDLELGDDGSLRSRGGRGSVWLAPNGVFTIAAIVTDDFLGWALNQRKAPDASMALNSHVTAEYVLEFCRFVHQALAPRAPGARWDLCISIEGFDRLGGVILLPGLSVAGAPFWRTMYQSRRFTARAASATECIRSTGSAGQDAYRLMVALHALFGAPPDGIPYVENSEVSERIIREA